MASNLSIALMIGASVGGAMAGIKRLQSTLHMLRDSTLTTTAKLKSLAGTTALGLTGTISGIKATSGMVMNIAEPAIKFESAMADVKKVVDFKSPEGFANLSKDILNLTRTLPMTAEELAAITASGGQLGVAEEDLKDFTTTIAKMSVAFDMSAEDSGDAMAKLANVYKIPIKEIGNLGDAINELSNSSPAKASDIVSTLGRIGGVAKQFGLTENAAAALSNSFISLGKAPEVASTAINGMLTKLMTADKGGKKFQDALKSMGLNAKDLKKAIGQDAQGALTNFLKQIQKLPKEKQMGALVDLFGLEYADDVAVLAGNVEVLEKSLKTLQDTDANGKASYLGSMEKEFSARAATTENGLQLLKNSVTEFWTALGAKLLPVINNVAGKLGDMVHWITDLTTQNGWLADTFLYLGGAIAGVFTGFSALTAVIGSVSMGWVVISKPILKTISGIRTFLGWGSQLGSLLSVLGVKVLKMAVMFGKGILMMSRALLTNPIGLLITAIAVAAYLIYDNWEPISAWFSNLWTKVSSYFQDFCTWVQGIWNGATEWVSNAWSGVSAFFGQLWNGITQGFIAYWNFVTGTWQRVGGLVASAWNGVKSYFSALWQGVTWAFTAYWNFVSGIWAGVTDWVSSAWSGVSTYFGQLWENVTTFFGSGIGNISATILNWSPLGLFYQILQPVLNLFGIELPGKFSEFGSNLIQGLVNGIRNAWDGAKEWVIGLGKSIKGWFTGEMEIHSPSRVFKGYGENIVSGLAIGIAENALQATQAVDGMTATMQNNLPKTLLAPAIDLVEIASQRAKAKSNGSDIAKDLASGINHSATLAAMAVDGMGKQMQNSLPKTLLAPAIELADIAMQRIPNAPSAKIEKPNQHTTKTSRKLTALSPSPSLVIKPAPIIEALPERLPETIVPLKPQSFFDELWHDLKNIREMINQWLSRLNWHQHIEFTPILNNIETAFKPILNEKKGFLGSLWDDIKFGANFVGNLLGINQTADYRTPDFNPNTQISPNPSSQKRETEASIFRDYQPLNRNAITHNETTQNAGGIVVNFNPTIHVGGNQTQGVMEQVQQGVNMSLVEFERLLNRVLDQRQRRAY